MVELDRVDICFEVSMISSSLPLPWTGHLKQLYTVFLYLKKYHTTEMVFDPPQPTIVEDQFEKQDWTKSVCATDDTDLNKSFPENKPEPQGNGLTMRAYVDADHSEG